MANFVALTDAETNAKAFLRQAIGKKLKDNFDNLDARTSQVENFIRHFNHFNPSNNSFPHSTGVGGTGVALAALAYSVGRLECPSSGVAQNNWSLIRGQPEFVFNSVTRPVIFEGRFKWDGVVGTSHVLDYSIGLWEDLPADPIATAPSQGVWLDTPDASNFRFSSKDGAGTFNGTNFTRPSRAAWFTLKIELTDTPSNRALCSIDGVLKETITLNLPVGVALRTIEVAGYQGVATGSLTTPARIDLDRHAYNAVAMGEAA